MTTQTATIARLVTLMEGVQAKLDEIASDAKHSRDRIETAQRDIEILKQDVAEMKPVTEMVTSYRSMAMGALGILGLLGGSMYAFWQWAKAALIGAG